MPPLLVFILETTVARTRSKMRRHLELLRTAHLDQRLLLWDLPLGASTLLGDQSSTGCAARARRRLALVWRVPTILPNGPLEF